MTAKDVKRKTKIVQETIPSIPYKRAEDLIDCIGPGFYDP